MQTCDGVAQAYPEQPEIGQRANDGSHACVQMAVSRTSQNNRQIALYQKTQAGGSQCFENSTYHQASAPTQAAKPNGVEKSSRELTGLVNEMAGEAGIPHQLQGPLRLESLSVDGENIQFDNLPGALANIETQWGLPRGANSKQSMNNIMEFMEANPNRPLLINGQAFSGQDLLKARDCFLCFGDKEALIAFLKPFGCSGACVVPKIQLARKTRG